MSELLIILILGYASPIERCRSLLAKRGLNIEPQIPSTI